MKHQIFIGIFLSFIISIQFTLGQQASKETIAYHKIDSLFNASYEATKTGAAFAIIKNGKTTYQNAKGLANVEYQLPITDSSAFNIASVSKQFTTYLALLLEQEGKLSFEDDIRIHLPELNHLPHKISIKQLTNHTHGLPNLYELAHLKGILPNGEMTHREIIKMLLNVKQTNFKAGEKYQYNNTGYSLLAEIIERVGEKRFEDQLDQKIFLPLGMTQTKAIGSNALVVPNKAYSYQWMDNKYQNYPKKMASVGSSGINTSIHDLVLWAKNYQNPTLGSAKFYDKMQEATYLNSGKKINYGLGVQFGSYKSLDIVFHGGGDVGYRSYLLHVPKHQLSIVVLANSNDFSPLDMVHKTLDLLLIDDLKEKDPKKTTPSRTALKKYEGTYEFQPGVYFNIIVEKDSLYFQPFGTEEKHSLPVSEGNSFEFPYIPHSKFVFYEDRFDFHIADFTYECFKTSIELPNESKMKLEAFTGVFKNQEHQIIYELVVLEDKLILKRGFNTDLILTALTPTSFYSPEFGILAFIYDSNGQVKGFKASGQNFQNIVFEK